MSLLGKPLSYRATRRDARYRRAQSRIYNFLERPRGARAVLYHMLVFLMVFMCLALSVFSTIDEYEVTAGIVLFYMETVVVIWFAIEFALRLWSSGCRSRYQGSMGRLKFLRRPFCIIDVTTILASVVVLGMGSSGQVFAASALRGLRFFQILRMVRMDRRGGTWKLLGSVVYAHRQELITTLYIGFLGLIFASFLVYMVEKDVAHSKFNNFAQALWWGVITLCTVGYGDMVPETWPGKLIASFCALLGISFFALPAGILGSGFALKVQQQQRQKHMIRRRQPAASLIQALWRCYASDEHSMSIATWKIHQVPLPSPPSSRTVLSSSFKHNASFVSRLPTIRRHKSTSLHSPSLHAGVPVKGAAGAAGPAGALAALAPPHLGHRNSRAFNDINASSENLDEDDEPRYLSLTPRHKAAIRFIRKLKYFLARKRFREALKPYDVKDVIEQYSSGHADLLNRTKNLQFRLDQILGKQGSKAKDVYASKISLASRVVKIERQVDDIENKLDQLMELYLEDRKRFPALGPPSPGPPTDGPPQPPQVPPSVLRPRPILVDKQFSEPNSPIAKNFDSCAAVSTSTIAQNAAAPPPKRPMHRGYSDLGNRIRKRVTLSAVPHQYGMSSVNSGISGRDGEVIIVVPTNVLTGDDPPSPPRTNTESSDIVEVEIEEGSGGECEGDVEIEMEGEEEEEEDGSWGADGYADGDADADADGDSLAAEDTALLRRDVCPMVTVTVTPAAPQPPHASHASQERRRVRVDLHARRSRDA